MERGCHPLLEDKTGMCISNYGCRGEGDSKTCLSCCDGDYCNFEDPLNVIVKWKTCYECIVNVTNDSCSDTGFNPYDRSTVTQRACPGDCQVNYGTS